METFDETGSESGSGAQDRISGLCGWLDSFPRHSDLKLEMKSNGIKGCSEKLPR